MNDKNNSPAQTALTLDEQTDLGRFESVIEAGLQSFLAVGNALCEISARRLYRATHKTFRDYCLETWKISRPRAYQLASAAKIIKLLPPEIATVVDTESKARELAKAPTEIREQVLVSVLSKAKASAKRITAAAIKESVIELVAPSSVKPINRKTIPTPSRGLRGAEKWWYHSATPAKRGHLLRTLFASFKTVSVEDKAAFKKSFERLFDSCVEEENSP